MYSGSTKNTAVSRQEVNQKLDDHAMASAMRHSSLHQEGAYHRERHFEQRASDILIRNMLQQHRERESAAAQGATSSDQKLSLLASAAAYPGDNGRGQFSNKDDYYKLCSKLLISLKSPSVPSEMENSHVDDYRNQEQLAPPLTDYSRGSSYNSNRSQQEEESVNLNTAGPSGQSGKASPHSEDMLRHSWTEFQQKQTDAFMTSAGISRGEAAARSSAIATSNEMYGNTNEAVTHAAKMAAMSGVVMAKTEVDAEDTYARKVTNESRQQQEAPKKKKSACRKRKALTFAQKLMALLNEEECKAVIHWMPEGDSFCIADRATFMAEVLPKYFNKEAKLESFARRLKRWGFQRINNSGTKANAVSVYSCKMFRRDKPELCEHMCDDRQLKKVKKEPSPSINYHRQQPCWGGDNQAQFSMQRPQDNMPINASLPVPPAVVEDDSCPPRPASVPSFAAERKHSMDAMEYYILRANGSHHLDANCSHHNLDVTAPGVAMRTPYQPETDVSYLRRNSAPEAPESDVSYLRRNSAPAIVNRAALASSPIEKMQSKRLLAVDDTSSSSTTAHFRQESPSHHLRQDSGNNETFFASTASASTATAPGSPKLVLLPNEPQGATATASYGGNYRDIIRTEAKQRMDDIDEDLVSCEKRLLLLTKMKDLREKRRRLMEFM